MRVSQRAQAEQQVDELAEGFMGAFEGMRRCAAGLRVLAPFPAHLTTITITGRLGTGEAARAGLLDKLEMGAALLEELGDPPAFEVVLGRQLPGRPGDPPAAKKPRRSFSNSVILRERGGGTQSIKLFNNSSIQVAGCPSAREFRSLMGRFSAYLEEVGLGGPVVLEACQTQMINVNVSVHKAADGRPLGLCMARLAECAARDWSARSCSYDPELGPGLKVRVDVGSDGPGGDGPGGDGPGGDGPGGDGPGGVVTAQIFRSGIVCLKGAKLPAHVGQAYAAVLAQLDATLAAHPGVEDAAYDPGRSFRTTTSRHPYAQVHGYPCNSYLAVL